MNKTKPILAAASIALAITLTQSCSSDDSGGGSLGNEGGNAKANCIQLLLQNDSQTPNGIMDACGATRSEVFAYLPPNIGTCVAADIDTRKTLGEIAHECGVQEIPIHGGDGSSNSGGGSSNSGGGSSSSSSSYGHIYVGIPAYCSLNNRECSYVAQDLCSANGKSHFPTLEACQAALGVDGGFVSVPCGNTVTGVGTVACDGKTYNTVQIGDQVWMKENLDYDVPNNATDVCYDNAPSNCNTYGRLYDWATAMNLPPNCNRTACSALIQPKHQGICPSGWHIPSYDDWSQLFNYVGGYSVAGQHLKAKTGWQYCGPSDSYTCYFSQGEDTHGFSALPGGNIGYDGSFSNVDDLGNWWSASESKSGYSYAHSICMSYNKTFADLSYYYKNYLYSVRCVKDSN